MTSDENKKLVLEHYEDFLRKRNDDAVRKQLAPDFIDHEMPPGTPPGPEGALQFRAMLLVAFPDLQVKIEDIISEGDIVAVRASWTGTHKGSFALMPLPPTSRSFQLPGMVFWRIRDGKIVERWATMDRMGLYQQLTAKP